MAATPVVNSNFSLNLLQQRELDDAFYSSLDSDEEKEENEKNNMLIRQSCYQWVNIIRFYLYEIQEKAKTNLYL